MKSLTHTRPFDFTQGSRITRPVIIQINLDISLLFWPLFAACWLAPSLAYLRGWGDDLAIDGNGGETPVL